MDDATLTALVLIALAALYAYAQPGAAPGFSLPALLPLPVASPSPTGGTSIGIAPSPPAGGNAPVSAPASVAGQFDIASAIIVNSPDVRGWPVTCEITSLQCSDAGILAGVTPDLLNQGWPDIVPSGWDGAIEFTLWMFWMVGGQLYGSGFIQTWRGEGPSGGPPSPEQLAANFVYGNAWAPMNQQIPNYGDPVGYMLVAGGVGRQGEDDVSVTERSNLVTVPFGPGSYTF